MLALQSELAQEVTREIRVALTPEEERRLSRTWPIDPEAHFAFLRGQYHASKGSPADLHTAVAYCRARTGETSAASSLLGEVEATRRQRFVSADWIALVHMGLGHRAAALEWLETAFEERAPGLALLGVMPPAYGLRSHPGFQGLVRRVGLPSADLRRGAPRAAPG